VSMILSAVPCLSLHSLKIDTEFLRLEFARLSLAFGLLVVCAVPSLGQKPPIMGPTLEWRPLAGVSRYRLQIAGDKQFNDMIFDAVVSGHEYVAKNLGPGRYYWRVAAANSKRYLKAGQFEVKPTQPLGSATTRVPVPGWFAVTGEVPIPMAVQLGRGYDADFIATDSDGTVYALDSAIGALFWTSRYRITAQPDKVAVRPFVPVIVDATNNTTLVIVAFERGLRALEGLTGTEVWQAALSQGIVGGIAADLDDKPGPEVYLTDDKNNKLLRLNASTGQVESESKLSGKPVGPPVLLNTKNSRALLVPLQGNSIEVRNRNGELVHSIRLGLDLTTAPVAVETVRGVLMLVGTKDGLVAFETTGFRLLGRTVMAGGHYPTASLAVVDLDGDKVADRVVMISNLGRVTAVDLSDGKVKWFADGFNAAASVAFADLNGGAWLDVLVPDNKNFATGLSGSDGMRIWESTEANRHSGSTKSSVHVRRLAAATLKDGRIIVVGNDPFASGLRAVELRKGLALRH
jgi:outer membrane protein assembly factor BamB